MHPSPSALGEALPVAHADLHADVHADVHAGRDGWLFLTGGTNRVLAQYGRPGLKRADLWRWRRLLAERARRCAASRIGYAHLVVPEKLTVLRTEDLAFDADRAPALRLERWLRFSAAERAWIDLVRPFRAHAGDAPLYHRTDTHWTFEGCRLAYEAVCRRFGVPARPDMDGRRTGGRGVFAGDLGMKYDPPRAELAETCLFETQSRRVHANSVLSAFEAEGRPRDAHIGAHAVFRNESEDADPRVLVLFGDSYAHHTPNPYTATLTAMLADTFREVHMLWSTSVDWTYIERVRPDFVLTEIAERFMVDVPPASFDIHKLARLALSRKAG